MASSFLAPALNGPVDYNLAVAVQQAHDRKATELKYGTITPALRSPWERAVQKFNDSLNKDEIEKFALESCPRSSLGSFLDQVSTAKNEARRKRSKALDRIDSVVERATLYSGAMDIFSQAHPGLMFAWGSMKFLMQVVMSEKRVAEKLAQAIADVMQIFGRCEQYAELFPSHERLLEAIGILYADVLNLLVRATRFYEKNGIKRFMSASVTPFEIKFAPIVADVERHGTVVEREAGLAHKDEQKAENNLQRNFRETVQAKQIDQVSKEVRLWLQPSDTASAWRKLRQIQTASTCTWLLDKETYSAWKDAKDSGILWIYGNPGSGKSVLASYIIEQLRPQEDGSTTPLLYYFCSGRDENRRASVHVLRSLIFQLQTKQPDLASLVEEAYKSSMTKTANSFEELWALFTSLVGKKSVICVIDGLDECQNRDEEGILERSTFAHRLVKLVQDQSSDQYIKVLLTSRNEPDLRVAFLASAQFIHTISISPLDIAKDIQLYISSRVNSSDELSCLPEQIKCTVVKTLETNACGMFIWARLMLEDLEKCDSEKAIEDALKSMPRGLSELYDRSLQSLTYNFQRNEGSRDLGCFILCWTVCSSRPLTLTELSEARCIVPGQSSLLLSKKPYSLVSFRRLIEKTCAPLVEVHNDGLVQLVHHTTKEYLTQRTQYLFEICQPLSTFGLPPGSSNDLHYILSQACLSYLSRDIFEAPLLGIRKRFRTKAASDVQLAHPFLDYASSHWLSHVGKAVNSPYAAMNAFIHTPQALTWIETTILLQGGVDKLATIMQHLPTFGPCRYFTSIEAVAASENDDFMAVVTWFDTLQRVILTWGGTLNQTPSEIRHLAVLPTTKRYATLTSTQTTHLQSATLLEDPTNLAPTTRELQRGASFILCANLQHIYVISSSISMWDPFVARYHWLSMQALGELRFPRLDGMMARLAEVQVSAQEQYVVAVKVGASHITVAVWGVSDEGFDALPWGQRDGFIGCLESKRNGGFGFSHRPCFSGGGWARSARYTAFSLDESVLWTPECALNLMTGEKIPLPQSFSDEALTCATWSVHGQRLACLRGSTLEVYENNGRLIAVFHINQHEDPLIVDFSKSGRYVLLLEPSKWRYSIFDLQQQTFSFLPPFKFAESENPLALEVPEYEPDYTITHHAFSANERYVCCIVEDLNYQQSGVLAVWDRQTGEYLWTQIWSSSAKWRPSHAQFDESRPETLLLLIRSSIFSESAPPGFIQIDLTDKRTFAWLRESNKTGAFLRYDICLHHHGGRAFQKSYYKLVRGTDDAEQFIDVVSWNLHKSPPEIESVFTVPRVNDGWRDGYAQSNGSYGDWYMSSKESSMAIVGGRIYSVSKKSHTPTLICKFDPASAWDRLIGEMEGKDEEEVQMEITALEDNCFWSFLSPDESLICFHATKEYTVIFDVRSGKLRWCHRLKGSSANDYWAEKPVFHPSKPILAWIEQFGKGDKEDFSSLKHCSIYIADVSNLDNVAVRFEGFTVDYRSDLIFSPCGSFLYAGVIGRDSYDDDQRKLKLSKIDLSTKTRVAYIAALSPIKGPSYCSSPNPELVRMTLKDNEVHFLVSAECKVMLAKIEFDGTIKWKLIASLPGPPKAPCAVGLSGLSGWNVAAKENRFDIVLAEQQYPYPTVINTWDETPDEWDEIHKVEHDDTV